MIQMLIKTSPACHRGVLLAAQDLGGQRGFTGSLDARWNTLGARSVSPLAAGQAGRAGFVKHAG